MKRLLMAAVSSAAMTAFAAPSQGVSIGVYDVRAAGGQGVGPQFILPQLQKAGYDASTFTDFSALTLSQFDIVFLHDVHSPGEAAQADWQAALTAYVRAGGSVLQSWHHHILAEVGHGVRRVYGSQDMHIKPGHPSVAGLKDFKASYKDHIVEAVGPQGTVIVENAFGDAVAVAGTLGKGKVISTGLAVGTTPGSRPKGAELAMLNAFFAWLKPDAGLASRLAPFRDEPVLRVSPLHSRAAAGFPASIKVTVAGRGADLTGLSLDGQPIDATPARVVDSGEVSLRVYNLKTPTEPGRETTVEHTVSIRCGIRTLAATFHVQAVYAPPTPGERRGVWLHVGADRRPEKVMPALRKLGIDMAVLRIAGGTAAFYGSKVQPDVQDPMAEEGGDWLAESLKYAKANGVELHPYVNNCVVEGRTSAASLTRLREAGRLQQDPQGREIAWFCPSSEENIAEIERPMKEIVTRYDVPGIQYDFIRYPNANGCFCPRCRALFEKESGAVAPDWPKDVLPEGPRHAEWVEFRCRRISAIVQRISTTIRKEAPGVKISAAVFTAWPSCRENNGQDWVRWCKEGWLDFVCPMNYTNDNELFAANARIHRAETPANVPVVQGMGINSGNSIMNDPAEVALQMVIARKNGANGVVGFCYRPGHTETLIGPLQNWPGWRVQEE